MAPFRTTRERRCWLLAAVLVVLIYGSAYFVQFLLLALRERGALEPTIWGAFGLTAAVGLGFLVRQRPGPWEVALLATAAVGYVLWLRHLTIIQERIHLIQYGALGGLVYAALRERWGAGSDHESSRPSDREPEEVTPVRWWRRRPAAGAILISGAAGWGDELVQGILPNRVYDLRDVALNTEAAALFVVVVAARQRLRAERARRQPALAVATATADGSAPPLP
jgi:hypothetical protein